MLKSPYLKTPFQIGSKILPSNILYAPLAGCSDYPFRQMSAKYQPGLMYCEMVKMEPLTRGDQNTRRMLDYDPAMRPIGGQICGSKPELAGAAARIIEELGFDIVDLNCGCPVDKVTKDGSGSAMLKTPEKIGEVIANMVAAVKIPVTVKIRLGWDETTINAEEITRIAEAAGASAICIHGRTRKQAYTGAANWDYIRACKQAAKNIKVIGNGDLFDANAVKRMFEHTGCDAVLVARGTMGQPWIVEDILRVLGGEEPNIRTLEDRRKALLEHFLLTCAYHNEHRAVVDMRRVGCWYFKKAAGVRFFRGSISKADTLDAVRELIMTCPLGEEVRGGPIADGEESTDSC